MRWLQSVFRAAHTDNPGLAEAVEAEALRGRERGGELGERGRRGNRLPKGFQKVSGLVIAD